MKSLYRQFIDLVKQNAFEQAERIHRDYGRNAYYIYPSYDHVVLGITRMLEDDMDVPREIIKIILEDEEITTKLVATALGYGKDEDDK